ncbi:uncharacterized protein LOC116345366 [Contarinia nasturtii]|uniref:uncharacterized protein LOC116345366 n=1 Tax=Contarinia nasturtii TaxID=265458 RepID=UPI0012D38C9D|nr:uncharacterized protein LOC116345366 [Contarinia nasturtii]
MFWCSAFLFHFRVIHADYTNSTINVARTISDDFQSFQRTGKRTSARDGRLFTFETKNDDIQVGIEFSVPFISIPVKRSVNSMKSWASSAFVTDPVMNINTGSIALTGAVLLGGFVSTYLWKSFMKDQSQFVNSPAYYGPYTRQDDQFDDENPLNQLIDKVERVFHKYDIDVTTCVQRLVCITIRNAAENVAKGNGTSAEKIFDGLSSTWILRRLTAGTAVNDAILAGQRSADCEKKFFECNMKSKNIQQVFDLLHRTMNN